MQFRQSKLDFPQMIKLGDKMPSFGLHRFRQGLRFVPVDDEGFTLRGDKRRIEYKGRLRSHRFTILGDTAFEYDCILNKEPEGNVIRLRIEGAENFDFFRQPSFVENPFLQGSYAVYKKETLVGEGTGKLCHIHRPEITDARGRRCWGSLAVVGNELHITVPEKWLSEAAYPVIVDPVVGTATVGAFVNVYHPNILTYVVRFSSETGVEKFILPDDFNGQATAYFYSDKIYIKDITPLIYSDNNNLPNIKLSSNEGKIVSKYPADLNIGWQSAVFNVNNSIAGGSAVWFGFFAETFYPRCDYGGSLVTVYSPASQIYNNFPVNDIDYTYEVRLGLKLSMYFTYVVSVNYSARLSETARINDTKIIKPAFNRKCTETSNVLTAVTKTQTFFRNCVITAGNCMRLKSAVTHIIICSLMDRIMTNAGLFRINEINAKITDGIKAESSVKRKLFVVLRILSNSVVRGLVNKRFLNSRIEITLKSRIGGENK